MSDMPLSAVPYKLSITYIHLFLSRYQYPVFHNSYQYFKSALAEKKKALADNICNNNGTLLCASEYPFKFFRFCEKKI